MSISAVPEPNWRHLLPPPILLRWNGCVVVANRNNQNLGMRANHKFIWTCFTMFRAKSKNFYVSSIWQSTRCAFLIVAWLYLRYIFFVKCFSGILALPCTFICNFCVFPVMTFLDTGLFFVVYFCSYQAFYLRVSSFVLHWTCAIQVFKLFYILKFI